MDLSTRDDKIHKICTRCGNSHPPGIKDDCRAKGTSVENGTLPESMQKLYQGHNKRYSNGHYKLLGSIKVNKILVNGYFIVYKIDTVIPNELYIT